MKLLNPLLIGSALLSVTLAYASSNIIPTVINQTGETIVPTDIEMEGQYPVLQPHSFGQYNPPSEDSNLIYHEDTVNGPQLCLFSFIVDHENGLIDWVTAQPVDRNDRYCATIGNGYTGYALIVGS